jgi:general secretion pathway protein A
MYAEHFGFSKLPFSATPDPQVVFNNSLYQETFATLQYGVLAKKGFVLITGEVGTGKTTLLRKLLHSLGPTVHSVFIFYTQVSFVELLRLILDDLNLAHKDNDKLTLIETLNQYLIERSRQGHIVTLLIDEAQNLCDEALEGLRLLSNLETDTEKLVQIVLMGQPELEIKLDQPKLRQLKQRITLQCRLAPLKKEEVGAYIEFRLNAAGFRGQSPFQRDSLEAIAFYSKGIPRLVNIICDNALLIAYAASQGKVAAQMVEEVARDLQLGPSRPIEAGNPVNHKVPDNPVKPRMEEEHLPEFENVLVGAEKEHRPELQPKRSLTGLAVGIFLGAVTLGGIAVYLQQSKIYLSDRATSWGDFSREGNDYLSDWTVKVKDFFERTEEHIADSAVKAEDLSIQSKNYLGAKAGDFYRQSADYLTGLVQKAEEWSRERKNYFSQLGEKAGDFSRRSKDYLAGLAARMGEAVRSHWKSLKQVKPITKTSEDNSSKVPRLADSNDVNPSKRTEPLFGHPAPVAEKPPLISQELKALKPDKKVPLPATKEPAETQIAKNTGAPTKSRMMSDSSETQRAESHQLASLKREPAPLKRPNKRQPPYLGNFEVVEKSFVRNTPESDAEIITTLQPGTGVRVESKTGRYLLVRSLNDPGVHGYVHEEDAFFKRIK